MSTLTAVRTWRVADLPAWIRPNVTVDKASGCFRVAAGNGIRIDKDGYARAGFVVGIHRLVFAELVDDIPDGHVIDHVKAAGCVWRDCCRPDHMQAVTVRTNTMRGCSFAVTNALKTHCGRCRAAYDLFNTYEYKGRRDCRRCIARRVREYKARQRRNAIAALAQADPALTLAA